MQLAELENATELVTLLHPVVAQLSEQIMTSMIEPSTENQTVVGEDMPVQTTIDNGETADSHNVSVTKSTVVHEVVASSQTEETTTITSPTEIAIWSASAEALIPEITDGVIREVGMEYSDGIVLQVESNILQVPEHGDLLDITMLPGENEMVQAFEATDEVLKLSDVLHMLHPETTAECPVKGIDAAELFGQSTTQMQNESAAAKPSAEIVIDFLSERVASLDGSAAETAKDNLETITAVVALLQKTEVGSEAYTALSEQLVAECEQLLRQLSIDYEPKDIERLVRMLSTEMALTPQPTPAVTLFDPMHEIMGDASHAQALTDNSRQLFDSYVANRILGSLVLSRSAPLYFAA